MAKGVSIHIGLNRVDPNAYNGWDGALSGCINDANDMRAIATSLGYSPTVLLDGQATSHRVIQEIAGAAQQLSSGDILFLSYSGHGGQVDDVNGDEVDGKDETWVLYDRMLIDDELYSLWGQFTAGVRIIVLSDSCHSGTVLRRMQYEQLYARPEKQHEFKNFQMQAIYSLATKDGPPASSLSASMEALETSLDPLPRLKAIPQAVQDRAYEDNLQMYRTFQWAAGRGDQTEVQASVLLISGCQDSQLSLDGTGNGLFTGTLKQVWNNGSFSGNYETFWRAIQQLMPPEQTPNFYRAGVSNLAFEQERPFTIGNGAGPAGPSSSQPAVSGPAVIDASSAPPSFTVQTGSNRFYIFEITSDPLLFDITNHGSRRRPETFYATWDDPSQPARLTGLSFNLPQPAWDRLKNHSQLYFRIGTTSSQTGWDNYTVSTSDTEGHRAPSLRILGSSGPSPVPATGKLRFPSGEEFDIVDPANVDDGIDYNDPTSGGSVPLIRIAGRRDARLAANFIVNEFVDDDRSNYARISPELVTRLQGIRDRVGELWILTGYRHPRLNQQEGGAERSQHMAGKAAMISSPNLTALELAEVAIDVMGCGIGIGLGRDYVDVDIRGSLATWADGGAPMNAQNFRTWVNNECLAREAPEAAREEQESILTR